MSFNPFSFSFVERKDTKDIAIPIAISDTRLNLSRIQTLKNQYPSLFEGTHPGKEILELLSRTLPENFYSECYLINVDTDKTPGRIIIRVPRTSSYLSGRIAEGESLFLDTNIDKAGNVLYINNLSVKAESAFSLDEVAVRLHPSYGGERRRATDNAISSFLASSYSVAQRVEDDVKNWEDYLNWKKQLTGAQLKGVKYCGVYCNSLGQLVFLLAFPSKEEFVKSEKILRNSEVRVFSNQYSSDKWEFSLNPDIVNKRDINTGVELGRYLYALDEYELGHGFAFDSAFRTFADSYRNSNDSDFDLITVEDLFDVFESPYMVEVAYELNEDWLGQRPVSEFSEEQLESIVIDELISKIDSDGFLSVSAVPEFILNARLLKTLKDFKELRADAPSRYAWLFDIAKASEPKTSVHIDRWYNIDLNESQKEAVQKMLDAPDVCLIQGPPGTGKTTVIAEAINQFTARGQSVLLASQANLAVNNALERVRKSGKNPYIRAVRLASDDRKLDESVEDISLDNALWDYYASISDSIQHKWLIPWEHLESDLKKIDDDYAAFAELCKSREEEKSETEEIIERIGPIQQEIAHTKNLYLEIEAEISAKQRSINGWEDLLLLCKGSKRNILSLSPKQLQQIIPVINNAMRICSQAGILLRKTEMVIPNAEDNYSVSQSNRALIRIFENITDVKEIISSAGSVDATDIETNRLIEDLKIREAYLLEQMDISDDLSVISELKATRKKLREAKMTSRRDQLRSEDRELFTEEILSAFDTGIGSYDTIVMQHANSWLASIVEFETQVSAFVTQQISKAETGMLESQLERHQSEIEEKSHTIEAEEEQLKKLKDMIEQIEEEIHALASRYNCEESELDGMMREAKRRCKEAVSKGIIDPSIWHDTLSSFVDRLKSEAGRETELHYAKENFLKSCNVVGISCTENPKVLADNGLVDFFDVVIIDEVSKATPPELLIPLIRARKAILVGDHRQLPPLFGENQRSYEDIVTEGTKFSAEEDMEDIGDTSLLTMESFERFKEMVTTSMFKKHFEEASNKIKATLTVQFRMHPQICDVVKQFYENRLTCPDADIGFDPIFVEKWVEQKAHGLTVTDKDGLPFITPDRHVVWIDSSNNVDGSPCYESRPIGSSSAQNELEQRLITTILAKLDDAYSSMGYGGDKEKVDVGIITLYGLQMGELRKKCKSMTFNAIAPDVNTVDKFQGKEKQIIITSLVRNKKYPTTGDAGFVTDFRRINVAFSRAQKLLIIIGACNYYSKQMIELPSMTKSGVEQVPVYSQIVEHLHRNACYFTANQLLDEDSSTKTGVQRNGGEG